MVIFYCCRMLNRILISPIWIISQSIWICHRMKMRSRRCRTTIIHRSISHVPTRHSFSPISCHQRSRSTIWEPFREPMTITRRDFSKRSLNSSTTRSRNWFDSSGRWRTYSAVKARKSLLMVSIRSPSVWHRSASQEDMRSPSKKALVYSSVSFVQIHG